MSANIAIHKVNKLKIVNQTRDRMIQILKDKGKIFLKKNKKIIKDFATEGFRILK